VTSPNKPAKVRIRKGGWWHPLAITLLLASIAWFVGAYFATSDDDFPRVGEVPVLSGIGGWNWLIAIVLGLIAVTVADSTRPPHQGTVGWRYAGHAMVASGVIGLVWIVVFYVISNTETRIPIYSDLGQWNILIGMGFIIAAFGFATKWE
jgi:hypothetical protein